MAKFLPDDPRQFAQFLRERCAGHAPGYDIAVYARPHQWAAIAKMIEDNQPKVMDSPDGPYLAP